MTIAFQINPADLRCNYFIKNDTSGNATFIPIANPFGGIPQNLLINLVCWFMLFILFAILRRSVGNYDRRALVRKEGL